MESFSAGRLAVDARVGVFPGNFNLPDRTTYLTNRTQKQVISFLSDDDPVQFEEEACRKHLLQTPIKVHVEVCVDVATSEESPSSDQGFVITSIVSSPSISQNPDL